MKKILEKIDKETYRQILRNSFIVFDFMLSTSKSSFGNTLVSTGSSPVVGKIRDYSLYDFKLDPVLLKSEKTMEIIGNAIKNEKVVPNSAGSAKILISEVLERILEKSDNAFGMISSVNLKLDKSEDLSHEDEIAMTYLRFLSDPLNFPIELPPPGEDEKRYIEDFVKRNKRSNVENLMVFISSNVLVSMNVRTNWKDNRPVIVSSMSEAFETLVAISTDKETEEEFAENVWETFDISEIPLFLIDFDR